jgi:hypothetical protein
MGELAFAGWAAVLADPVPTMVDEVSICMLALGLPAERIRSSGIVWFDGGLWMTSAHPRLQPGTAHQPGTLRLLPGRTDSPSGESEGDPRWFAIKVVHMLLQIIAGASGALFKTPCD